MSDFDDTPTLRRFRADDAPWLVERHATLYARDEGFDDSFGPLVAGILSDFVAHHDPERERGWIAEHKGHRLGSIFCVAGGADAAKLRLFLLVPEARGKGLGKQLLGACMGFARKAGYSEMVLWTHESHRAACALYKASGWQLIDSKPVHSFGVDLVEQSWKIRL
ncbi:GNAT family N-acetyltransferase [Lutimaribacter marinistellae]|uniref:GNAT family N-acetyltransferase n=1 Tax=Lutimaribacter marinistellae TaxID=1820329 RepID=A0ABV7TKA2_9RHOB